jgi:hypothetical protein
LTRRQILVVDMDGKLAARAIEMTFGDGLYALPFFADYACAAADQE